MQHCWEFALNPFRYTAALWTHILLDSGKAGDTAIATQVMDNWEGQPGAAVLAKGASASRERRLLEWANDMEAIVNTQVCAFLLCAADAWQGPGMQS